MESLSLNHDRLSRRGIDFSFIKSLQYIFCANMHLGFTRRMATYWIASVLSLACACGQVVFAMHKEDIPRVHPGRTLDPSLLIQRPWIVGKHHTPLTEEYIWTKNDAAVLRPDATLSNLKKDDWKVDPHAFRAWCTVQRAAKQATLYLAGPRHVRVWMNGVLLHDRAAKIQRHAGFTTFRLDVAATLHTGRNLVAIEAVRGYGSHHHTNSLKTSWLNSGEVMVAKLLVQRSDGHEFVALSSDGQWKSKANATGAWMSQGYDDSAWEAVTSLGGMESDPDFFQWNADAGLYAWPGYFGEASYLANYLLPASKIEDTSMGTIYDFGREINGRAWVQSAQHTSGHVEICYGESKGELLHDPFLGEIGLDVAPHTIARGPKTGFRYLRVKSSTPLNKFKILAEGIYDPVVQTGHFICDDETINRIFITSAYTAHLSMQDSILDGIKRDRGRWIGDDEVIHRVIADLYGDSRLVRSGLIEALGTEPAEEHVNGLPGYSAWWIIAEYEYIRRWNDIRQLQLVKDRMIKLLAHMQKDIDGNFLYREQLHQKPFIDWAYNLSSDTSDARLTLDLEYLYAFRRASDLLALMGESGYARQYRVFAEQMQLAAQKHLRSKSGGYGDRLQSNAMAVLSGVVTDKGAAASVGAILGRVRGRQSSFDTITPYYGSYLLEAMSKLNRNEEALQWMRHYWGGMLKQGATSFWEAWDPFWQSDDPHARLQADDQTGYYTSLAHGWSSGPAAWLLEEIAGIQAIEAGYRVTQIDPELCGMHWMKAEMPTPLGSIHLHVRQDHFLLQIPAGMKVLVPAYHWRFSGHSAAAYLSASGYYELTRPGRYAFAKARQSEQAPVVRAEFLN